MNRFAISLIASALSLGVAVAASDNDTDPSSSEVQSAPVATVQLEGGAVAAGIGYVWGHGTIKYQDTERTFKVSGLSIVDVGAASLTATGDVYHLSKLSDFDGNYVAWSAGLAVGGGGSATYLRNEHGVVLRLLSTQSGVRFNLSGNGVRITLK